MAGECGARCEVEQRVTPLDRVGCYVPGGRYPLPSSLLMTAIPAKAAGVGEVMVACPRPDPVVMAAALEAGVSRLFRVGGAHAVAALAYGTATVPRVDKMVGPGNRYVAAAKALVAADCGIDFYAGPTEIVIVASKGPAEWIAADLIAQAEHDPDARAVFITPSGRWRPASRPRKAQMPDDGPARESMRHTAAPSSRPHWTRPWNWRTTPPPNTWWWTTTGWPPKSGAPARSSSADGRRRWQATTRLAAPTCCRRQEPRGCAVDCRRPTSCGR